MSKTSETKNKILKMLETGSKRLIDICPELGLSAPTVSQHLKELRNMHLIEEVPDQHFKNEKYYRLARKGTVSIKAVSHHFPRYAIGAIAIAIITAGIFAYGFYGGQMLLGQNGHPGTLNILLTDPPHVPAGTQSLNITYSGIQLHVVNRSVDEWISINATGSVNLLKLINTSRLIASAQLPSNAVINAATFNITKATMTIGNATYPVYLQSRVISTGISDRLAFNGSSNLLFDFSPTVIPTYINGTQGFEMLPSISAAMIAKHDMDMGPDPSHTPIVLNRVTLIRLQLTKGSLNISSASVSSSGGNTHVSITVRDNSTKNITVEHVLLLPYIQANKTGGNAKAAINQGNPHITWLGRGNAYPIDFSVLGNGTMVESQAKRMAIFSEPEQGLSLASGQSAILTFNGTVSNPSAQYNIVVIGSEGAFAMYPQNGNMFYLNR
ncbi:MAG: ArsR family transcriptional regulator [Candidatus Micrarchaeota archaeon]|nr:ArsR family transcriptional regulator [Candidatus Micrarchaeota archaeon]